MTSSDAYHTEAGLESKYEEASGSSFTAPLDGEQTLPLDVCILVTGAAGFIGSWLVQHLASKYPCYRIISLDKYPYAATQNCSSSIASAKVTTIKGDFADADILRSIFAQFQPNVIFHLAGQTHVDKSFKGTRGIEFSRTNVLGTHILLDTIQQYYRLSDPKSSSHLAEQNNIADRSCLTSAFGTTSDAQKPLLHRFIYASTDEVYGPITTGLADETHQFAPTNPYAASKASAEMLLHSYYKSFRLPLVTMRLNNVYGPRQYPEKIIPRFATMLAERGSNGTISQLPLHGDGLHKRRYVFVTDIVEAFDIVLHNGTVGEAYNTGTGDAEISNLELALKMSLMSGMTERAATNTLPYKFVADRPFNDSRYATNSSKLNALGWTPRVGFDEGLKLTMEWYSTSARSWWGDLHYESCHQRYQSDV